MDSPGSPALRIPAAVLAAMVEHCRREAPLECCGILGGSPPAVTSIHPLTNIAASESFYEADPTQVIEVHRLLRQQGACFLAIYHSHPQWPAQPSKADLKHNHWGELPRIIISLSSDPPDVRIWKLLPDSYQELPWVLQREHASPG